MPLHSSGRFLQDTARWIPIPVCEPLRRSVNSTVTASFQASHELLWVNGLVALWTFCKQASIAVNVVLYEDCTTVNASTAERTGAERCNCL